MCVSDYLVTFRRAEERLKQKGYKVILPTSMISGLAQTVGER